MLSMGKLGVMMVIHIYYNKQREDFASFLRKKLSMDKPEAVATVKNAMKTGPDLVKLVEAVQEKYPISTGKKLITIITR